MSQAVFSTVATNPLASQPSTGEKLILRSTSAADTMVATVYGTISAAPGYSAVTLAGKAEVQTSDTFAAISQALLASAGAGVISARGQGVAAVGDCTGLTQPTDGHALTVGLNGLAVTYTFRNTIVVANDIQIGSGVIGTMASLTAAINGTGTPGVDYGIGTAAHPHLSAAVDTSVVTLTDRLACNRQLAWVMIETGSHFAKRVPRDGVDGPLRFSFAAGILAAANKLTFSTEAHDTATLPALMLGTSNYVQTGGNFAVLRLWADHNLTVKAQESTDLAHWVDTADGNITVTASTLQRVFLASLSEFLRLVIVTNANVVDTILDARVIY